MTDDQCAAASSAFETLVTEPIQNAGTVFARTSANETPQKLNDKTQEETIDDR